MLNENAKLWVAALRSGKYKQGTAALHYDDHYCCLGIGCVVAVEHGCDVNVASDVVDGQQQFRYNGHDGYLPQSVRCWLGLASEVGQFFRANGDRRSLSGLNDNGSTFAEIADIIESEPKGLFVS